MDKRKEKLLKLVVENYVKKAEPVGSKFLVETSELGVSGATIRNEMRDLEEAGYLTHPHTSAGRMPTEAGYKYYVENIMKPVGVKGKIKDSLKELLGKKGEPDSLKKAGKMVAGLSNSAVILALGPDSIYYTGISNLFSQPEFQDYFHVVNFSSIFDQCEEKMEDLFSLVEGEETHVFVGSDNPLGSSCSLVASRVKGDGLFVLMGPMRMDYNVNIGLINYISQIYA